MEHDDSSATTTRATGGMRLSLWVSVVVLVLLIGVIAWRQISLSSAEKRFEAERQQLTSRLEADKASAVARTRDALAKQNEQALMLFATALGWTIRDAMMRDNLDQIDQYPARVDAAALSPRSTGRHIQLEIGRDASSAAA